MGSSPIRGRPASSPHRPAHRPAAGPIKPDSPDKEPTLKADPFAQLKLLDVQDLDARIDRLRHQLATLPEQAELTRLEKAGAELDRRLIDARTLVQDLTSEQEKVDADVEAVKVRRVRDRDRMDKGLVSNPKDLERMTHELVSLERRISSLEDDEIEVMERLEEAQTAFDAHTAESVTTRERLDATTRARDARAVEIESELSALATERVLTAEGMPADLVALYERLRAGKDGVGAAALRARACSGCQLRLDPAELDVIKRAPSNEVVRCAECQRILVRTSESGP